ncbi:MAG: macro domain-containing protein, partial [Nocardioidaceae bacterium]
LFVIHVVGPIHGRGDRAQLVSCYANALAVADEIGASSVAFPLVSAGVYGWPLDDAIAAAVDTLFSTSTSVDSARIVAFGRPTYDAVTTYLRGRG